MRVEKRFLDWKTLIKVSRVKNKSKVLRPFLFRQLFIWCMGESHESHKRKSLIKYIKKENAFSAIQLAASTTP